MLRARRWASSQRGDYDEAAGCAGASVGWRCVGDESGVRAGVLDLDRSGSDAGLAATGESVRVRGVGQAAFVENHGGDLQVWYRGLVLSISTTYVALPLVTAKRLALAAIAQLKHVRAENLRSLTSCDGVTRAPGPGSPLFTGGGSDRIRGPDRAREKRWQS